MHYTLYSQNDKCTLALTQLCEVALVHVMGSLIIESYNRTALILSVVIPNVILWFTKVEL